MSYSSQAIAKPYFTVAITLFAVQVLFGLIIGMQYVAINIEGIMFDTARLIHTNLLIIWLLFGFMGASYYIVPEEAEQELYNPKLAIQSLWLFLALTIITVLGYLLLPYATFAKITGNQFFPTMGREYLEQPTIIKLGIFAVLCAFTYNISMTILHGRKTIINLLLLTGIAGSTIVFIFAFYNSSNLVVAKYYRWWLIHFWFEGTWELIMEAILAYIIFKVTGNREIVEKWLYIIVAVTLTTVILGIGHHYYWIGVPEYWQWIGTLFSVFELLPFFFMLLFVFNVVNCTKCHSSNKALKLWALSTPIMAFLGAGVLGFLHTLAPINYYSHGTQITSAHGHLAFYSTYVMIVLAIISYTMPILQNNINNRIVQKLEILAFWLMTVSMSFMVLFIAVAGIMQVYIQRATDLALPFIEIQNSMMILYWLRGAGGLVFFIGVIIYIIGFFYNRHLAVD
ncbi:cbb3-type cytochrome c oxidase subunit I [Candidatus Halobeggiatoa sp. HSG11]|nr:cbb3-type cytochrome c oxidase subunit I [Candidatus Halobeggiatoa sp. HSG11]